MRRTVEMTDGGVYQNLGLAPLRPGRSPAHTAHAHDLDYVIAVDAGRRRSPKPTSALTPFRLARRFDITYNRTQDASRTLLTPLPSMGSSAASYTPTWRCATNVCRCRSTTSCGVRPSCPTRRTSPPCRAATSKTSRLEESSSPECFVRTTSATSVTGPIRRILRNHHTRRICARFLAGNRAMFPASRQDRRVACGRCQPAVRRDPSHSFLAMSSAVRSGRSTGPRSSSTRLQTSSMSIRVATSG